MHIKLTRIFAATCIVIFACCFTAFAYEGTEIVVAIPFENTSKQAEFNWVGESIADSLNDMLKTSGMGVITSETRKIAQKRLAMPLNVIPSLASSLKLAREVKATILIVGEYNIQVPEDKNAAASLTLKSRVIRVQDGSFLIETDTNGARRVFKEILLTDALGNLQSLEGQLAYGILLQIDRDSLPFSLNEFIEHANKIPARAFEAYIKGLLVPADDAENIRAREIFLINAFRIYSEEKPDAIYEVAAIELGHLYLNEQKYQNSIDYFSRIGEESHYYAEAAFYVGFCNWKRDRYDEALAALRPVAEKTNLAEIYNMMGVIAIDAARAETKDATKSAAQLNYGIGFLKTAFETAPDDPRNRFNYALALVLHKDFAEAAEVLRKLAGIESDGEAYFLLAKCFEELKDAAATEFDNQARILLDKNDRYAQLQIEWNNGNFRGLAPRFQEFERQEFVALVATTPQASFSGRREIDESAHQLNVATEFFANGRFDEAIQVIDRILIREPMNAQAYLLKGKIYERQGNQDDALDALKVSQFYDNNIVETHILLGRIYIFKRNCLQARSYLASAQAIDAENPDVRALERQVERCSK